MDLLLGLDIGTTAVKAAVYDPRLHLLASAQVGYQKGLASPREGWVEHNCADLWQGVVAAVRSVAAAAAGQGTVTALSLSTQGGTTIALDGAGKTLRPAISWMDTRATGQSLRAGWSADRVYRTTGWWSDSGLSLRHIRWLNEHEPELFAHTHRFVFVNDFVLERMTGAAAMDPSNAAMTMLYGLAGQDWHDDLLQMAGVGRARLSPLAPSGAAVGRLLPAVAAELGLAPGVIVANGAHDQYCTALGAGIVRPGSTLIGSGTAWVLFFTTERPLFDSKQVFHPGPHVMPGHWGALSSIPSAGASIEWYLRQMSAMSVSTGVAAADKYRWLNEGAAQAPAGSKDLLFMPHLGGFYSAAGEQPVRGAWVGLTMAHSSNEMSRSIMEGVAYEVRRLVGLARESGAPISSATMVGGATTSPLWPHIVADVLGIPVAIPAQRDAACRGAAILAGVGAGVFAHALDGAAHSQTDETVLSPDAANVDRYDSLYETYCDAFSRLCPVFSALAG
jgi:xylulokinase